MFVERHLLTCLFSQIKNLLRDFESNFAEALLCSFYCRLGIIYLMPYIKKQEIKPEGLLTKVVQHELDHLNGRLFVDHISELKRRRIRNKIVKQK